MKIVILFGCLLISFNSFTQKFIRVKDAETKQGLPYASVECFAKKWGMYSDSTGKIIFRNNELSDDDTMKISFVGYNPYLILYKNLSNEIFLEQKKLLSDFVINTCKKYVTEDFNGNPDIGTIYNSFEPRAFSGSLIGVFFPNKKNAQATISAIEYIASKTHTYGKLAPFGLRFFFYDSVNATVGEELFNEQIIVKPKKFGKNKIDLSGYKIEIPENGIVIAFELINLGDEYIDKIYSLTSQKEEELFYGFVFKSMLSNEVISFGKKVGSEWKKRNTIPFMKVKIKKCK